MALVHRHQKRRSAVVTRQLQVWPLMRACTQHQLKHTARVASHGHQRRRVALGVARVHMEHGTATQQHTRNAAVVKVRRRNQCGLAVPIDAIYTRTGGCQRVDDVRMPEARGDQQRRIALVSIERVDARRRAMRK